MPVEDECLADTLANTLFASLTTDVATVPNIDFTDAKYTFTVDESSVLYDDPANIELADLTTVALTGTGVFDKLMSAADLHIKREYTKNRITGDQYAEVYTKIMGGVLSTATQFLLTKDQARWQAIQAQMTARVAEIEATKALIELETARMNASRVAYEMKNAGAQYALTKINIANANQQHCLLVAQTEKARYEVDRLMPVNLAQEQHNLNYILPLQKELLGEQVEKERAQTLDTRRDGLTPTKGVIGKQKSILTTDLATKDYQLATILPQQVALLAEQIESERAKTKDTRTDTTTVEGSIGKQKDLYDEQIASFVKDAKYKVGKMFLDSWITQKTLDEGLTAPTQFTNTEIDEVIEALRTANSL